MKRWRMWCCAWLVLTPAALRAQDVRVRLYTNHTPNTLVVKAVVGELHWRTCPACTEKTGLSLTIGGSPSNNGDIFYVQGKYVLQPVHGPTFAANYPLRVEATAERLLVTVTIPLEEYVAAALAAESGDFKNDESMKAMAVAARTYALRFVGQHEKDGFDFCDTTHCQVVGWKGTNTRVLLAVDATRGEVLRFAETIAETYYHANCGGTTAAAREAWPAVQASYLPAHNDPYCTAAGGFHWESSIAASDIDRALRDAGLRVPQNWKTLSIAARTESGRVQRLQLRGGGTEESAISGSTFRFAVDRALGWNKIRSDAYHVRHNGDHIIFSGHGSGHGVGLCQAGAEEMAREGRSYQDILAFYYPGTIIGRAQNTVAQQPQWQQRTSERIELLSTQVDDDGAILGIADKLLQENEAVVGWTLNFRPTLRIFTTMDAYRNTTGQPGWVAASTRGHVIRLQPLRELQRRSILESTLRHELLHLLIEAHAKAGTPLWFREGLVLFLSSPNTVESGPALLTDGQMEIILRQSAKREEVEKAYRVAQNRVTTLIQQNGKDTVLRWLSSGIPREIIVPNGAGSPDHH